MNNWNHTAAVGLLKRLLEADRITEPVHDEAVERVDGGDFYGGIQYALKHAGLG